MWIFDQTSRGFENEHEILLLAFLDGWWGRGGLSGLSYTGVKWLLEDQVALVCHNSLCMRGLRSHSCMYAQCMHIVHIVCATTVIWGIWREIYIVRGEPRGAGASQVVFARLEFWEDSVSCSWSAITHLPHVCAFKESGQLVQESWWNCSVKQLHPVDNPRFDSEPICQYGTRFSPMTSDVMNIDILFELLIERPGKVSRWSCLKPLSWNFFEAVIISQLFVQNCAEPAPSHLRWQMKDSHVIRFKNSKKSQLQLDRWNVSTIIKFLIFHNCTRCFGQKAGTQRLLIYEMQFYTFFTETESGQLCMKRNKLYAFLMLREKNTPSSYFPHLFRPMSCYKWRGRVRCNMLRKSLLCQGGPGGRGQLV